MDEFGTSSASGIFHLLQQPSWPGPGNDRNNPNLSSENHNEVTDPNTINVGASNSHELAAPRHRGRSPGARNMPRLPVFFTQESPNAVQVRMLEFSSGSDMFECLATYARVRQQGICLLSARGKVINVNIHDPTGIGIMSLPGQYEIVSLVGTFLPWPAPAGATGFTVYLSTGQGHVLGGQVVGPLFASGPVILIAISFSMIACDSLSLVENEQQMHPQTFSGSGGEGGGGSNPFPVDTWAGDT